MTLAPLYTIADHPLLGDKFEGLDTDDERIAQHLMAEMILNLQPPAYTEEKAEELAYAVVQQINFQLQQGLEPEVIRSVSTTHPGIVSQYRDRFRSPVAWAIVERVTGLKTVGFRPPGYGV